MSIIQSNMITHNHIIITCGTISSITLIFQKKTSIFQMEKFKDQKSLNSVIIIKRKLRNMVELISKFQEQEEQVILVLMNLLHQLIVVQDSYICIELREEMHQNLSMELIMFPRLLLQWVLTRLKMLKKSLLWLGLKAKLILSRDQLKDKFQMMSLLRFYIIILMLHSILINQLVKNYKDLHILGRSKEILKIPLFLKLNIGF